MYHLHVFGSNSEDPSYMTDLSVLDLKTNQPLLYTYNFTIISTGPEPGADAADSVSFFKLFNAPLSKKKRYELVRS